MISCAFFTSRATSSASRLVVLVTSSASSAFVRVTSSASSARVRVTSSRRALRATRPRPAGRRPGRRIEIYRDLGVLLLVEDGEVVRAVHTSTGSGGITPVGDFKVYNATAQVYWRRLPQMRLTLPYLYCRVLFGEGGGVVMVEYPGQK